MSIYISLLIISMIGCLFDLCSIRGKEVLYYINIVFMFLVAVLRHNIGVDYEPYSEMFASAHNLINLDIDYFIDNEHKIEWGYLLLESTIKTFTDDFVAFIIIYDFIIFFFLYQSINKINLGYKNLQLFIVLCFLYPLYIIEAHRQALAMVIFLYNINNIINKRFLNFMIWSVIAFSFHKVSLITVPLYFLYNTRYNKFLILTFMVVALLLSYNGVGYIINLLYQYFSDITLVSRIYTYFFTKHDPSLSLSIFATMHRMFIFLLVFAFYKKINYTFGNLVLLYLLSFLVFSNVGVLAGRISSMFIVSYIYYFPILFHYLNRVKGTKIILGVLFICYGSMIFYKDIHTKHPIFDTYNYLPYKSVLD